MAEQRKEDKYSVRCERSPCLKQVDCGTHRELKSGPETSCLKLQKDVRRRLLSFGLFTDYPSLYFNAPEFSVNGFVYRGK